MSKIGGEGKFFNGGRSKNCLPTKPRKLQLLQLYMQRKSKTFQHGSFRCRLLLAG